MSLEPKGLGHIAIAVASLKDAIPFYRDVLGFNFLGVDEVPAEGMRTAFLEAAGVTLEVMESTNPEGPVGRFVAKKGPGVHHLTFRVDDINQAVNFCRAKGIRLIEPAPREGAHGARVAFLHPQSTGGILIELQQPSI